MAKKQKIFLYLFVALFVLNGLTGCATSGEADDSPPKETVPVPELIKQADDLYKQREDLSKVRQALQLLKRARMVDAKNYEIAWTMSKYNYFLGDRTTDEKERDKAFADGIAIGKNAVMLEPNKPEGYFWQGANLGGQAKSSPLSGAANIGEIKQNMQKVIEIQPDFQGASAYLALAQLEMKTRGLMGGKATKAREYLEQAFKISQTNAYLYQQLAEVQIALNQKDEARKTIDRLMKLEPNPDYLPEYKDAIEKAKKLLETK
jgi:tetratricopeptide (TPR) repeat protein